MHAADPLNNDPTRARIAREPKGGPDVVLVGLPEHEKLLLNAGDTLSVRGFTARVATLPAGVGSFAALTEEDRVRVSAEGKPMLDLTAEPAYASATAAAIGNEAYRRLHQ